MPTQPALLSGFTCVRCGGVMPLATEPLVLRLRIARHPRGGPGRDGAAGRRGEEGRMTAMLTTREAVLAVLAFLAGMGAMAWVRRVADGVWL